MKDHILRPYYSQDCLERVSAVPLKMVGILIQRRLINLHTLNVSLSPLPHYSALDIAMGITNEVCNY